VALYGYLACVSLFPSPVYAIDPNKRVTQYLHTSWRIQDASLPAGMFSITQTSDGFLWFVSLPGDIYRFDGVRFLPFRLPAGAPINTVGKIFADQAGGVWVVGDELVHLKGGVVTSHFKLQGILPFQSISEDPAGALWIGRRASDEPLCRVTDQGVECFGQEDGIPLSDVYSILADDSGGFWLGGTTALVHWRQDGGVSEQYPVKARIAGLARAPDGTLWIGMSEEGPGLGLQQVKKGVLKPFVTPTFDGSKLAVTSLMFDRDGNLWVGTDAKGLFRIRGDAVEHYGRTDGLSGDSVWALFEDREGIVWAGTTSGVDSFRDPRVVTYASVEGLGKDLAAGIMATRDGTIWVANNGSLDSIKNGVVSSINKSKGLPGYQVASMLEDRAGNMWVGVDDGLYLFKDGRFRRLPEPDKHPSEWWLE
jgi:ligand-binding sensor domain-containing protein